MMTLTHVNACYMYLCIVISITTQLDGNSGVFELTASSNEGEYENPLSFNGTIDIASRSLVAQTKGRSGHLRLKFVGARSHVSDDSSVSSYLSH
jgi:hypothetical protein